MKIESKQDLILDFIKQFRDLGAENCFNNGMCYWFAYILKNRFRDEHCHVMYDEVNNHFGCEINGIVYDINGIAPAYNWRPWYEITTSDRLLYLRILRDCRDKVPADVLLGDYCNEGYYDDWGNLICGKDNHPCGPNEPCIFEEDTSLR
jgi:hypothetical protein